MSAFRSHKCSFLAMLGYNTRWLWSVLAALYTFGIIFFHY